MFIPYTNILDLDIITNINISQSVFVTHLLIIKNLSRANSNFPTISVFCHHNAGFLYLNYSAVI